MNTLFRFIPVISNFMLASFAKLVVDNELWRRMTSLDRKSWFELIKDTDPELSKYIFYENTRLPARYEIRDVF